MLSLRGHALADEPFDIVVHRRRDGLERKGRCCLFQLVTGHVFACSFCVCNGLPAVLLQGLVPFTLRQALDQHFVNLRVVLRCQTGHVTAKKRNTLRKAKSRGWGGYMGAGLGGEGYSSWGVSLDPLITTLSLAGLPLGLCLGLSRWPLLAASLGDVSQCPLSDRRLAGSSCRPVSTAQPGDRCQQSLVLTPLDGTSQRPPHNVRSVSWCSFTVGFLCGLSAWSLSMDLVSGPGGCSWWPPAGSSLGGHSQRPLSLTLLVGLCRRPVMARCLKEALLVDGRTASPPVKKITRGDGWYAHRGLNLGQDAMAGAHCR